MLIAFSVNYIFSSVISVTDSVGFSVHNSFIFSEVISDILFSMNLSLQPVSKIPENKMNKNFII